MTRIKKWIGRNGDQWTGRSLAKLFLSCLLAKGMIGRSKDVEIKAEDEQVQELAEDAVELTQQPEDLRNKINLTFSTPS